MPMRFQQFLYFWFVMKWRIIHDNQAVWPELWHKHLFHPRQHRMMGAAFVKQHGGKPFFATLRHDEIGTLAVVSADFSMHLLAT